MAEARLIRPSSSRSSPRAGSSLANRARPLSITVLTPSIVSDVSAMFVARITLRRSLGRKRPVLLGLRQATRAAAGRRTPRACASGSSCAPALRISSAPGRKTSTCPASSGPLSAASTAPATASADAGLASGLYTISTGKTRPSALDDGTAAQEPRDRLGVERGRHHDDDQVVADRLPDLSQQGDGQVGVQAPLVELVEDDRADAFEERVGDELPVEHPLGLDDQPRLRPDPPLEPDLIADLLADPPAVLLGDPVRRRPRGDPPGLEQHDLRVRGREQTRPGGSPAAPASSCPSPAARPAPPTARGGASRRSRGDRVDRQGCHRSMAIGSGRDREREHARSVILGNTDASLLSSRGIRPDRADRFLNPGDLGLGCHGFACEPVRLKAAVAIARVRLRTRGTHRRRSIFPRVKEWISPDPS